MRPNTAVQCLNALGFALLHPIVNGESFRFDSGSSTSQVMDGNAGVGVEESITPASTPSPSLPDSSDKPDDDSVTIKLVILSVLGSVGIIIVVILLVLMKNRRAKLKEQSNSNNNKPRDPLDSAYPYFTPLHVVTRSFYELDTPTEKADIAAL